ncbi:MAG: hypothetical protein HKM05_11840 [Spirochaetales bacterium]|nr:hypothetical protein [Spirochaetales bacterium]
MVYRPMGVLGKLRGTVFLPFLFLALFGVLNVAIIHAYPKPLFLDFLMTGKGVSPDWLTLPRPQLYLLAWSRDAKVLTAQTEDPSTTVSFEVWDCIDDRAVDTLKLPGWGTGNQKTWWTSQEAQISALRKKWDLHPCNFQMGTFPLIDSNDVFFQPYLDLIKTGQRWGTTLRLVLHGGGLGTKVVMERHGVWRRALLLGFTPSPYEDRILMIMVVQPSGWNGKETELRYIIAGASLVLGFHS